MSTTNQDPRRARSQEKLRKALAQVLGSRSIEDVSVDEVTRAAGVSRPTFYSNYKSLPALMEDCVNERLLALREVFTLEDSNTALRPIMRLEGFLEHVLDAVEADDAIARYVFAGKGDSRIRAITAQFSFDILKLRNEGDVLRQISEEDLKLYAAFFAGAVANVVVEVVEGNLALDRTILARRLAMLIDGGVGHELG